MKPDDTNKDRDRVANEKDGNAPERAIGSPCTDLPESNHYEIAIPIGDYNTVLDIEACAYGLRVEMGALIPWSWILIQLNRVLEENLQS